MVFSQSCLYKVPRHFVQAELHFDSFVDSVFLIPQVGLECLFLFKFLTIHECLTFSVLPSERRWRNSCFELRHTTIPQLQINEKSQQNRLRLAYFLAYIQYPLVTRIMPVNWLAFSQSPPAWVGRPVPLRLPFELYSGAQSNT